MTNIHIYQIFYNDATKAKLDPGFTPLDNTKNLRPDWYEYLPIKECFLRQNLDEDDYFGVFSPKFFDKTGMSSNAVRLALKKTNADVVSFSPWYAHLCLNRNLFIQSESNHPGSMRLFREIFPKIGIDIDFQNCVMSSRQAILCNYFVAKPRVWRKWLNMAEYLFLLGDDMNNKIGRKLRQITTYNNIAGAPMKVFILERLISALLHSEDLHADFMSDINKISIGYGLKRDNNTLEILKILDDLKDAYIMTGLVSHLKDYEDLKYELIKS